MQLRNLGLSETNDGMMVNEHKKSEANSTTFPTDDFNLQNQIIGIDVFTTASSKILNLYIKRLSIQFSIYDMKCPDIF